jgi:hypothetical protein
MGDRVAVMKCTCEHDFQDKEYGEGKRVHARKMNGQWVCTVCKTIRGATGIVDNKKKK